MSANADRLSDVKRQIAATFEIERLRAALQKIVDEADSDDGLTAWDGADIAKRALGEVTWTWIK